jgi:peptide deformylase
MSTLPIKLRLRFYGDASLRRKAKPVAKVTEKEMAILAEMAQIMRLAGGVGLAAPQVGINRQIIVIDIGEGPRVFINPKIFKRLGCDTKEEGCLSLPGVFLSVKRAKKITVTALNEKNEAVTLSADNLLARVIQHEMDHLKGKLLVDHANIFKKIELKRKLRALLKHKKEVL